MKYSQFISPVCIFLFTLSPVILSQQPYIKRATTLCDSKNNSTSVLGYTCNGLNHTCQAYLTFRAKTPFNSVSSISTLLAVNSSHLSQINSVPENAIFETNQMVLVPVTCSCSGQYYQANTSYIVQHSDTHLLIANNTFQGLSTCQAIRAQNKIHTKNLYSGTRITVPLRCACATKNQSDDGVNYLLSYLVTWGQYVQRISSIFGVDTGRTLAANSLSEQDSNIYPFTTLLVPLRNPPSSFQVTAPQPPPPRTSGPPQSGGSSRKLIPVFVGALGGGFLALIIGGIVLCVYLGKKGQKPKPVLTTESSESVEKQIVKEENEDSLEFLESISSISQYLKDLFIAQRSMDFAAIKKKNGDVLKEINLLTKINHFNLIRLSGVCFNEGNWYLVYEYASNGSLSHWIQEKSDQKILNWDQRLQIAVDVATGLTYLHCYTSPPHIHKDLNSSNVLLDRDFRAKISNVGLARTAEGQEGLFTLTRHIVGTKGYMAPEYLANGLVSPKLDVYAFGILVLEILTGKEVSLLNEEVDMQVSEVLASDFHEEDGQVYVGKLMDPSLHGNYPEELALLLFKLIGNCLKKDPSDRPNIDDIFQSLSRILTTTRSDCVG
ncbi:hypothetical protein RD792_016738 [Penstemon davidsonii]|uniref:LysM domain receptor-like kinase 4 n=1 Tax=Penstemon davidsonii TaxID=160366 RepID=A0ABR0CK64_9LAMI|nr:hypothetical protein RD792_016738 [Penstemon davidsonii]